MMTQERVRPQEAQAHADKEKQSEISGPQATSLNKDTDQKKDGATVAKIIQQFQCCDVRLSFVKCAAATRTTTYLFTLNQRRLRDLAKIDETLRRTLEVALETSGVSIVAPLPDSRHIAVIVPAKEGQPVRLADFVTAIRDGSYRIPCILGEDFMGTPVVIDLAECCHQLIAGATGSGKTMLLKAIIAGILSCSNPEDIKIILVDGKGVDFGIFEGVAHLACPVITGQDQAIAALRWLVAEIERRKTLFRERNVSQIWAYNKLSASEAETRLDPLPATLLMIDEVQVITRDSKGEVEDLLRHITQQGRIYGIVVVLATQRPSVDILQGSIKINLPGRVSFRLPSSIDSRVILDQAGAESLRRSGDLLAIQSSLGGLTRLQAPFVTDDEVAKYSASDGQGKGYIASLIGALKEQGEGATGTWPISHPHSDCGETTASNVQPHRVPVSKFAEVLIPPSDMEEWLTQKYPDRNWTVKLVYHPFLLGQVSRGWRRFRILYNTRTAHLIRSLAPPRQTDLRKLLEVGDQMDAFVSLLQQSRSPFRRKDSHATGSLPEDAQVLGLVEQGLVGIGRRGPFVLKEIAALPIFRDRISLTELPQVPSLQLTQLELPTEKIESGIRLHLCRIWQMTLEDHLYVGFPYYQARSAESDTLTYAACVPRRWLEDGVACSRLPIPGPRTPHLLPRKLTEVA